MSDQQQHNHLHETIPDQPGGLTRYQLLEMALRELLIEKEILSAEDIHQQVEFMDSRSPAGGAKVVARAWCDPAFKDRLLRNGGETTAELVGGFDSIRLIVVENTAMVHNVVVCTLCSCYPRNLLGLPPDWYKQRAYRSRVVREPRAVLAEFGTTIPDDVQIRVHDSTADMRYMVLPQRPDNTENFSEAELAACVSRDSMIGVRLPKPL